jgi:hypothetical protein
MTPLYSGLTLSALLAVSCCPSGPPWVASACSAFASMAASAAEPANMENMVAEKRLERATSHMCTHANLAGLVTIRRALFTRSSGAFAPQSACPTPHLGVVHIALREMSGPGEVAVTMPSESLSDSTRAGEGSSSKRRRRSPAHQAAASPRGEAVGPWLTPPPPGAAGAGLRSARKKTPLSQQPAGSRTPHGHGGSSSGKSVRFPRRVAVVLGCAEAEVDRTPHELPCTCDASVTCDGDYILGVHYQCSACSAGEADGGDSFDVCGACFDAWTARGGEWPHVHGREVFVVTAGNVVGDDGDEEGAAGCDAADGAPLLQCLGVSDLEGSRGLGPRLRLSEDCAAS